ncbi:hypothetical protein [Yinghuangia sp. YIM S09857]|uniref:hypothetical protein n=1 Tax=Yinghuangia sp. YIM S09857 TaxID=3436929 RepID=UPI003F53220D
MPDPLESWSASVTVAPMDGHVSDITDRAAYTPDNGKPLTTKQQLTALTADPRVTAALERVLADEVTPHRRTYPARHEGTEHR